MKGILLNLNEKQVAQDIAEKEREARDEKMREEGRTQARAKQFLDFDDFEDHEGPRFHAPAHGGGVMRGTGGGEIYSGSSYGGSSAAVGGARPAEAMSGAPYAARTSAEAVGDLLSEPRGRRSLTPHAQVLQGTPQHRPLLRSKNNPAVTPSLAAVDSEVQGAEELFVHMKKLRKDLKTR